MKQESIKKAKEIVGQRITDQMIDYEKEAAINKQRAFSLFSSLIYYLKWNICC